MESPGARAPSRCRPFSIALVAAAGVALASGPGRAAEVDSPALLSPALGCGQAQGAGDAALLTRARAGGRKPAGAAAAPVAPLPEEPAPMLLRAFYACTSTRPAPVRVGAGWLAVGPVRQG